jgi:hypothetical protein
MASDTETEVQEFVRTLVEHDRIDWGKKKKAGKRAAGAVAPAEEADPTTHAIVTENGKKVLMRTRFLCGSRCRCAAHSHR